jgi:hypothetical protein
VRVWCRRSVTGGRERAALPSMWERTAGLVSASEIRIYDKLGSITE